MILDDKFIDDVYSHVKNMGIDKIYLARNMIYGLMKDNNTLQMQQLLRHVSSTPEKSRAFCFASYIGLSIIAFILEDKKLKIK